MKAKKEAKKAKKAVKPAPKKKAKAPSQKKAFKRADAKSPKKSGGEIKRSEFRTNKKTGHPSYIYAKVGKRYKYIGITHSPITQGVRNIELEKNPNPQESETSYLRPKTKEDKIKNFKEKKKGWKFSEADKPKVKRIIKRDKK